MPAAIAAGQPLFAPETTPYNDRGDSRPAPRMPWLQNIMQKMFSSEGSENFV